LRCEADDVRKQNRDDPSLFADARGCARAAGESGPAVEAEPGVVRVFLAATWADHPLSLHVPGQESRSDACSLRFRTSLETRSPTASTVRFRNPISQWHVRAERQPARYAISQRRRDGETAPVKHPAGDRTPDIIPPRCAEQSP